MSQENVEIVRRAYRRVQRGVTWTPSELRRLRSRGATPRGLAGGSDVVSRASTSCAGLCGAGRGMVEDDPLRD